MRRVGWKERGEMEGEEDEMKHRKERLVNMCHAQLLSWCLPEVLEALSLHCGDHSEEGVREACRKGSQRFCVGEEDMEESEVIKV